MPINQDNTESTKSPTFTPTSTPTSTPGHDKSSPGMDASSNKPGTPTNAPGRKEHDKTGTQPAGARTPDANKQGDPNRDQKFGKAPETPNKGV